jgi:hypothetical protein
MRNDSRRNVQAAVIVVSLQLFSIACGTTSLSTPGRTRQEFLREDLPPDWSGIVPVQVDNADRFGTFGFAAVSELGQCVIHGEFEPGDSITLFGRSGFPLSRGVTLDQNQYSGVSTSFTYTNISISPDFHADGNTMDHDFTFAIVGEYAGYEVIPYWSWRGDWDLVHDLASQISDVFTAHDMNGYGNTPLTEICGNPEVLRFYHGDDNGLVVCFGETGFSENTLHTYVVIYDNMAFWLSTGTAGVPMIFSVDGELFAAYNYTGDHSGEIGQSVRHLGRDGLTWSNWDWSD